MTRFALVVLAALFAVPAALAKSIETTIRGSFGIPMLRDDRPALGMFRSGTTFLLQSVAGDPRVV